MVQSISWKEKCYNFVAGNGIKVIQTIFPEYFAKEPVRPTDRYIEYPFILSNLPSYCPLATFILDVGCSGSMFPLLLQALSYDVTGIDIRPHPMASKFKFVLGDICKSNFRDNTFDVITAISTIEHIGLKGRYGVSSKSMLEDKKAIAEIHRILRPNGLFLMTTPFSKQWFVNKNHRIYDYISLHNLLKDFSFKYTVVPSPEADYDIALIKAVK